MSRSSCASTSTTPARAPTRSRRPKRSGSTLVVDRDGALTACLVPSGYQLDTRALGKRVALAPTDRAEKVTGYVAGGISPFGQRRPLPTLVDETVEILDIVWVSGGRRGLEIGLAPTDLVAQLGAEVLPIAR